MSARGILAAVACAGGLLAGCGGERTFDAEEFVEAINEEGAFVTLGPILTTSPDGVEIRSVALTEAAPSPTRPAPAGEEGGSGAVLVLQSAEAAETELARCESALSLTCYRAANVVLRFEDLPPPEQGRIAGALQAIATE